MVYPMGGGEITGNPVIPAILSILSPLRLKGRVFVACASTLKVGAFGLLRDKFISSGLKVLLRKPFSYSKRVTDMLKSKNIGIQKKYKNWTRLFEIVEDLHRHMALITGSNSSFNPPFYKMQKSF